MTGPRPPATAEAVLGSRIVRGWPMPDLAGDDCRGALLDYRGWLPWAFVQVSPDWYVGLYSCDHGHAWTCGYGMVAHPADRDLRSLRVSPRRVVPDELERHAGIVTRPIRLTVLDWSWLANGGGAAP